MRNRNLILFFIVVISLFYGCDKLIEQSEQWQSTEEVNRAIRNGHP